MALNWGLVSIGTQCVCVLLNWSNGEYSTTIDCDWLINAKLSPNVVFIVNHNLTASNKDVSVSASLAVT